MAAYIVLVCESGGTFASELVGATQYQRGICPTGRGKWVAVEEHPAFDISQVNVQQAGSAFGAGFISLGGFLVAIAGVKAVGRAFGRH